MNRFDDLGFFLYAFGDKNIPLTDESFQRGLQLINKMLVANALSKKDENVNLDNCLETMIKAHERLKKWITDNYNITSIKKEADFFSSTGEEYYNNPKHNNIRVSFKTFTDNKTIMATDTYPDLIDFYYKSGACLRNKDNTDAHRFDFIINNINNLEELNQVTKDFLNKKINSLKAIYPTKEQFKEAYLDFLTNNRASGLSVDLFKDPMVNGVADERYLTDAEKKAIAKNIDSEQMQLNAKRLVKKAFNVQPITEDEAFALAHPGIDGDQYWEVKDRYLGTRALMKKRGDMLDKENVIKAIRAISSLKELHKARPWYQTFFGFFGKVGKELSVVNELKADLVSRGVDANLLNRAVDGDKNASKTIVDRLPSVIVRKEAQYRNDRANIYASLGLNGPDDPKLKVEYDHSDTIECNYYVIVDRIKLDIAKDDVNKFFTDRKIIKEKEIVDKEFFTFEEHIEKALENEEINVNDDYIDNLDKQYDTLFNQEEDVYADNQLQSEIYGNELADEIAKELKVETDEEIEKFNESPVVEKEANKVK